jgi:hypothetical protein
VGSNCCKNRYFLPEDAMDSDLLTALLLDPFLTVEEARREADAIRAAETREAWRDQLETLVWARPRPVRFDCRWYLIRPDRDAIVLWQLLVALVTAIGAIVGWINRPAAHQPAPVTPPKSVPSTLVVVTTCDRHRHYHRRFWWAWLATGVVLAGLWAWAVVEARRVMGTENVDFAVAIVLTAIVATILRPLGVGTLRFLRGPVIVGRVTEDTVLLDRVRLSHHRVHLFGRRHVVPERHLGRTCLPERQAGVVRQAPSRPDGQLQTRLQVEKGDSAVLELLPDDPRRLLAEGAVEPHRPVQVVDAQGQNAESWFHVGTRPPSLVCSRAAPRSQPTAAATPPIAWACRTSLLSRKSSDSGYARGRRPLLGG